MVDIAHFMITGLAMSEVGAVATRVASHWPWYITRAAGFTAAGLLILLMLSGIGQVTGLTYRFIEPVKAWVVHKTLAIALCVAIAMHVLFLVFDEFLPFTLPQIFVPFMSHYSNGTKLFGWDLRTLVMALGIFAAYCVAVVVLSSLGWINTKKKTWHQLHYLSYFVMLAVFVHALGAGSDLKYGLFREAWVAVGLVLVLAIVSRLWRARTLSKH